MVSYLNFGLHTDLTYRILGSDSHVSNHNYFLKSLLLTVDFFSLDTHLILDGKANHTVPLELALATQILSLK